MLAECRASGSPTDPTFEVYDRFPPTVNNEDVTATVRAAFEDHFGPDAVDLPLQSASEDFSHAICRSPVIVRSFAPT